MREMMVDLVERGAKAFAWKRSAQPIKNAGAIPPIAPTCDNQSRIRPIAQQISKLANDISLAVLVYCDVVHIAQIYFGLAQRIVNRPRWKTCPVLNAAKAFFLGGGEQRAIAHNRRRGIRVKSVQTEDNHLSRLLILLAHGRNHRFCK